MGDSQIPKNTNSCQSHIEVDKNFVMIPRTSNFRSRTSVRTKTYQLLSKRTELSTQESEVFHMAIHFILSCLPGRREARASPKRSSKRSWTPSLMSLKRFYPLEWENGMMLKGSITVCTLTVIGTEMPCGESLQSFISRRLQLETKLSSRCEKSEENLRID